MADIRTLETPPRTTGNPQQDLPLLVDWFYRAYQVIQESVKFINDDSLSDGDDVSKLNNDAGYIGFTRYELENELIKFSNIIRGQEPAASTDLTTKNYVDTLFASAAHSPVTVTDSAEIDFTLVGQNITAALKAGSIAAGRLDVGVTGSLGKADTAVQPAALAAYALLTGATFTGTVKANQYQSSDGSNGFTGTGAYTNFTIKNGLITNAT